MLNLNTGFSANVSKLQTVNICGIMKTPMKMQFTAEGKTNKQTNKNIQKAKSFLVQRYVTESQRKAQSADFTKWS